MNITLSIVIDILVLIFASVGLFSSIGILFLIFYCRDRFPINAPNFFICNTYVSIIFICIILFDMHTYNLYGDLHENLSFDNRWCYVRAYLLHVGLCLLYHSFFILACFRFFRVVLYKYKQMQNFRFLFRLVLIQWLMDFVFMIPLLFLHWFEYVPEYYFCEILFSNFQGLISMSSITYGFPMLTIGLIYISIIYYMKKTKSQSVLQNRQRANQRDVIVLRRIIILIGLLFILCFPTVLLWIGFIITGYINPIGYHIGWSTFALSLSIFPATSAFLTPQLRKLLTTWWRRNRRIQPTGIIHQHKLNRTIPKQ